MSMLVIFGVHIASSTETASNRCTMSSSARVILSSLNRIITFNNNIFFLFINKNKVQKGVGVSRSYKGATKSQGIG